MSRWEKRTLKMDSKHTWRATPGHKLCVMNQGALQIEYPEGWIIKPEGQSLSLHDREPPDDDMVLQVSVLQFPPLKETRPGVKELLLQSIGRGHAVAEDDVRVHPRKDVMIVWLEYREIDSKEQREAVWKHGVCHTGTIYGILSFGHWPDKEEEATQFWEHLLNTLIMDRFVEDPRLGPRLH
jgi:hypothetical protein